MRKPGVQIAVVALVTAAGFLLARTLLRTRAERAMRRHLAAAAPA